MDAVERAPITAAKGGCYNCLRDMEGVVMDPVIEGEGALFLCYPCIRTASKLAGQVHGRMTQKRQAEEVRMRAAGTAQQLPKPQARVSATP